MASLVDTPTDQLRSAVEPISVPSESPQATFSNWANTFVCAPERVFRPTTVLQCRQVLELARREGATVHPVGVGHSPSDLACTKGWLMRMEGLTGTIKVSQHSPLDAKLTVQANEKTATFYAGTTLHAIHASLAQANPPVALPNIGSISDQTIGGLISTASHGSGVTFPVLSKHVQSLVIALPQPGIPIVTVSPTNDPELFQASLCGLGATGLLLEIEVEVEPAFRLREKKESRSVDYILEHLDTIKSSAEHVRLWWYPDGKGVVVGRADRTYEASSNLFFMTIANPTARSTIFIPYRTHPRLPSHPILPLCRSKHPLFDHLGRSLGVVFGKRILRSDRRRI